MKAWKLVWYELKKALFDRTFLGLLAVLLLLQSFLLVRGERKEYTPAEYRAVYQALENRMPEESLFILLNRTAALPLPDTAYARSMLLSQVERELKAVSGRDEMLEQTLANAEQILRAPLFQANQSEADLVNLRKTRQDFEKAARVSVAGTWPERGILMLLENPYGDILILLLLLYGVYRMIGQGYRSGMELLISSCPGGRGRLMQARAEAIFVLAGLVWGCFLAGQLLTAAFLYSLGDLSRPVAAISSYVRCLYPFSVGGLLLVTFFWKWLCFYVLLIFQTGIRKWCGRELLADCLPVVWWGAGFLCWHSITDNSVWRILRYSNIYYFLRADQVWGNYNNIVIFGKAVSGSLFCLISLLVLCGLGLLGLYLLRNRPIKSREEKQKRKKQHRPPFRGLLSGEFYKCYRILRIGLLLLLLLGAQFFRYQGDSLRVGQDERIYRSYMNQWERELYGKDEELKSRIRSEREELKRAALGDSDVYTKEQANDFLGGLDRVEARYENLVRVSVKEEKPLLFFFEGQYERVISKGFWSIRRGGECLLLFVLLLSWYVGYEERSRMRDMIRTMSAGESRYIRNKLFVSATLAAILVILVYGPDLCLTIRTYGTGSLSASVYSLPSCSEFFVPTTIAGYLLLLYLRRIFILTGIAAALLVVTEIGKNTALTMVIGLLLFVLPYLLYYMGVQSTAEWWIMRAMGAF